jgi:hypothetical protein
MTISPASSFWSRSITGETSLWRSSEIFLNWPCPTTSFGTSQWTWITRVRIHLPSTFALHTMPNTTEHHQTNSGIYLYVD